MPADTSFSESHASVRSTFADDEEFRDVLEPFVASAQQQRKELESFWGDNALDEVRKIAHKLKGCGGGYGFPGLTSLAAATEMACKTGDRMEIEISLRALLDFLDKMAV